MVGEDWTVALRFSYKFNICEDEMHKRSFVVWEKFFVYISYVEFESDYLFLSCYE